MGYKNESGTINIHTRPIPGYKPFCSLVPSVISSTCKYRKYIDLDLAWGIYVSPWCYSLHLSARREDDTLRTNSVIPWAAA